MARSGSWVKGLFPKNSNHGLRMLTLLVSLYFLVLRTHYCDDFTTMPQTQRRSCPIAHLQIRKLKHVGVLNLER